MQHRCLTDHAELRAEGGDSRVVSGIAVRYGDEARLAGFRERIARGALKLPEAQVQPHDAARTASMPLGLMEWQDDEDALRFRSLTLSAGPRQDQALHGRAERGYVRGASLEFKPTEGKDCSRQILRPRGRCSRFWKAQVDTALAG